VVGILDGLFAVCLYRASPRAIFQSIASGLLGPTPAYAGGWSTAALGLALHFLIATVATAVFVAASRLLPILLRRWILAGLAHGAGVHLFMNFVVVPLSSMRQGAFRPFYFAIGLIGHLFLVGLPIAYFARQATARDGQGA